MSSYDGISPQKSIVWSLLALGAIVAILVLCCSTDSSWEVKLTNEVSATARPDGGGDEQPPVLSQVAFVFNEGTEGITDVVASARVGNSEVPLEQVGFYATGGTLVVTVSAPYDQYFTPRFYFLDRKGEVVEEYRANVLVNRSMITYHGQPFGEDVQSPYHDQPEEIQVDVGEAVHLTLENQSRLWIDDQFVDLWQVVHLPIDAEAQASDNCQVFELELPSSTVGIISDDASGASYTLEVIPSP